MATIHNRTMKTVHRFFLVGLALGVLSWHGSSASDTAGSKAPKADPDRVEAEGLHNVFRVSPRLFSGSVPEGDAGFRSLKRLGVKTVISVDGARPDVELARKYGMRYVHLPFGYDGIPRDTALRIARAVRDLPGPVYLHCQHGQHRAPAAAAVATLCLDERCTVAAAVAHLHRAGTDPHYVGLYAAPRQLRRPGAEELNRVPADFPETARIPALAQAMVGVDGRWDNLKRVRAAGWRTPKDNADLEPAHEALQLRECFREAGRLDKVGKKPAEFRAWLEDAEARAKDLEQALRSMEKGEATREAAERAFARVGKTCTHCHGRYRDVRDGR